MNILIFGDSIAWGAHDPEQGGWVTRLRNHFESDENPPYFRDAGDVEVYNLGICGDTTTGVLRRIAVEAESRTPEMIIFAIGINDAQYLHSANEVRVSPDAFQDNLAQLLSAARAFTKKVIFVGLTRVDEAKTSPVSWSPGMSYTNEDISRLDAAIEQFCADHRLTYIPMEGVISREDLFDGLHPNTVGHSKIFDRVRPVVESAL